MTGTGTFSQDSTFHGVTIGRGGGGSTQSFAYNTAIGSGALSSNTTGIFNTAIGFNALTSHTTGNSQVAIGLNAGRYITSGANNVTSSNSIYIGIDTRASADGNTNEIVIGSETRGNGSNTVTLGNSSVVTTILRGNVGIATTTPDIFGRFDERNVGISVPLSTDNLALQLNAGGSATRGSQIYMGQGGTRYFTISSNATESIIGTATNTPLKFVINEVTRLTIEASTGAATFTSTIRSNDSTGLGIGSIAGYRRIQYDNSITRFGFLTDGNSLADIEARKGFFSTNGASDSTTGLLANASTNDSTTYAAIFGSLNSGYRMVVRADGNVGIGTTSPEAILHVNKSTAGGEGGYIYIDNPAASTLNNSAGIRFGSSSGASYAGVYTGDISNIVTNNSDGASALTFGTFNGASSGERMRITSGGNILINQTSAITGVSTSIEMSGIGTSTPTSQASYNVYSWHGTNATWRGYFQFIKSRGATIGSYNVVANGDDLGTVRWAGADGSGVAIGAEISALVDGTPGVNDMPTRLTFSTTSDGAASPTERMRITSGGTLLIGTQSGSGISTGSSTNQGIDISSGVFAIQTNNNSNIYLSKATGYTSPDFTAHFVNGNYVGGISTNGSSTNYATASDYRLKQDLKDFEGINLINKIKTYDYQWKIDNTRMFGVIAHELQEVLPFAVTGEKDGERMQGVDYSKIVPVLVKAIQELKVENDLLKDRLDKNNIN